MSANNTVQTLLDRYGLVCYSFAYADLPKQLQNDISGNISSNYRNAYLNLIANVGLSFWHHLKSHYANNTNFIALSNAKFDVTKVDEHQRENWFDQRSLEIVEELMALLAPQETIDFLHPNVYPSSRPAPLIKLGELAGWSSPSPLGLGIHESYGPWLAYRALFVSSKPLVPTQVAIPASSPCLECDAPCVSSCPAEAVRKEATFNVSACADDRTQSQTNCATQCIARNACPVGTDYQHTSEQHGYHMTHALKAIVDWSAKN